VQIVWLWCTDAVYVQYQGTTDAQICVKVAAFFAQSVDPVGRLKERALKKHTVDTAVAIWPSDADDT